MLFSIPLLASLASLAYALPAPDTAGDLTERASTSEVVYLVNCNAKTYSVAAYYKNIANSHNLQNPDDISDHVGSGLVTWEGTTQFPYFRDTKTVFQTNIDSGAAGLPTGAKAGTGSNGKPFTCYKDNSRPLYGDPTKDACNSIYYCRPN